MSSPSSPDTAAVTTPAVPQPASARGFGGLRSMVISMLVIILAVLVWVAMVPRVSQISQPAVDVTSVAGQVRRETGWAISQPQLPPGWKATNARFDSAAGGVRSWHAGYLSPGGQYLSIDQTPESGATRIWILARTANGQADGTVFAAGRTWHRFSSRELLQRSLVSTDSATPALTTVLSGTASYTELAQFGEALRPVAAG